MEEEKGAWPFGLVWTAATKGWRTLPWPFILRAEPQPASKSAKARVEEETGTRPLGPVSTATTEEWKTRPWSFTSHAEQAISFGRPEEKSNLCYTFGMANDETPVEKALMASSLAPVISEDSVHSNIATLMAPAQPLPGEVRESLSKGASTPSGGRASPVTARPLPAPRADYSKNGERYTRQEDSSTQRRHAACCFGADGRGYPLQGSSPRQKQQRRRQHQQQQPRGSCGTFPAEYAPQAATTRSLHQHGHAGRQQHQQQQPRGSGGTFPAEYAAKAAITRSLHHHGHARYCESA